jgi:hypothetical protein
MKHLPLIKVILPLIKVDSKWGYQPPVYKSIVDPPCLQNRMPALPNSRSRALAWGLVIFYNYKNLIKGAYKMNKIKLFPVFVLIALIFISGCGALLTMEEGYTFRAGSSIKVSCTHDDWRHINDDIEKKLQESGFTIATGEERADYLFKYNYRAFFDPIAFPPHWDITEFGVAIIDTATNMEVARTDYSGSSPLGALMARMQMDLEGRIK